MTCQWLYVDGEWWYFEYRNEYDRFRALCLHLAKTMSSSGDYIGAGPKARRAIVRKARKVLAR